MLIPNKVKVRHLILIKAGDVSLAVRKGLMGYQLVGVVKAHQG